MGALAIDDAFARAIQLSGKAHYCVFAASDHKESVVRGVDDRRLMQALRAVAIPTQIPRIQPPVGNLPSERAPGLTAPTAV